MTQPIIPWPGGKRRLIKHLYPHFPAHEAYVEAFAGGAAALLMRPRPAPLEVLNDINSDLVCLYRCIRHHLDEFVRMFRWSLVSRQMFEWAAMERPETLTDIQRAARFYYLQRLAFGGKVQSQTFGVVAAGPGPRLNLLRIEEELSSVHLRLASVVIEHLPGRSASGGTIGQEPCSTWTRPIGRPKGTGLSSASSSTSEWLTLCGPCRARRSCPSTTTLTSGGSSPGSIWCRCSLPTPSVPAPAGASSPES